MVCPSVCCLSHLCTLLKPLDVIRSFGRDTHVVPSNTVLDRTLFTHRKEKFVDSEALAMLPIAKLLWPLSPTLVHKLEIIHL